MYKCNGNVGTNEARNSYIYKPIIHVTTSTTQTAINLVSVL